jgi:hypothetical protein
MKKKKATTAAATTAVSGETGAAGTGKKRSRLQARDAERGRPNGEVGAEPVDPTNEEGGANGPGEGAAEGDDDGEGGGEGDGAGHRKKKRRRRAKGVVASAIAEIRAEQLETVQRSGRDDGGEGEGSLGECH